jgi:recombination protein RecA
LLRSRAIVEANLNGLSFDDYVKKLNTGVLDGLVFLDRRSHVHHIDEDATNDVLSNLQVINTVDHGRFHKNERHNDFRFIIVDCTILNIVPVGKEETYDIRMASPFNNYVANKFVVHNSGKTSLTFKVIAEEQRLGNIVAFVDVEHALDPSYAATFGVNVDELVVSQPDGGEQALETVEALVRSGAVSLIVVDSVAALVPEKELSGDFGDANMGLQARLMSQACRKLRGICAINTVTVIFINQTRMNIGGYGSPVVTSGGKALSFYASVRLEVGRVSGEEGKIMSGGIQLGHRVKIKAVKNKVGPPFRTTEVDLIYNVGWDVEGDFIEYAVSLGAIEKRGSWLFLNGKQLSQGVNKLKDLIKADRSLYTEVEAEVQKALAAQKAVEDVKE